MAQSKSLPKGCARSINTKFLRALQASCALHVLLAYIALQKNGSKCVITSKKAKWSWEQEQEHQQSLAKSLSLRKRLKIICAVYKELLEFAKNFASTWTWTKVMQDLVNSGSDAGFLPLHCAKKELKISTFHYVIMFFGPSPICRY